MCKIKEATNIDFSDIKEIYDSLSESEQKYICEEPLVDLPYSIYRKVYTINNEKAGFIEYYKLQNSNEACLVFAIKEEFRHQGLLDTMLNEAYDYADNNNDIDRIIWGCTKDNIKSQHLAEKYGFEFYMEHGDEIEYCKDI